MIVTYYSSIHHQRKINLFTVSSSSITIIIFCLQSYVMKDFTTFSRCYMCQSVHMTIIISLFHQLLHRILVVFLNYCSPTVQHMGPLTATGFKSKVLSRLIWSNDFQYSEFAVLSAVEQEEEYVHYCTIMIILLSSNYFLLHVIISTTQNPVTILTVVCTHTPSVHTH